MELTLDHENEQASILGEYEAQQFAELLAQVPDAYSININSYIEPAQIQTHTQRTLIEREAYSAGTRVLGNDTYVSTSVRVIAQLLLPIESADVPETDTEDMT